MKRIISLVLCLLLMAAMATTAFAATAGKVDLTITGQTGHQYIAFQIFSGDIVLKDGKYILGNVDWGNGVTSGEAVVKALQASTDSVGDSTGSGYATTLQNEFASCDYVAQNVAKIMATWGDKLDRIKAFAELMFDKNLLVPDEGVRSNGNMVIEDLAPGYYLIMDAAVFDAGQTGTPDTLDKDFYTSILMSLTSNITIAVKGSVPTVDKLVSNYLNVTGTYGKTASNQINLDHYYQLTGTVSSDFTDYDAYYYQFVDTLQDGLDFGRIEEIAIKNNLGETIVYKADTAADEDNLPDTNLLKANIDTIVQKNAAVLTVTFTDLKTAFNNHTVHKGDEIVVRYSATLQPGQKLVIGKKGNLNEVQLIYGNNPYGDGKGKSVTSQTRVYTFPVEVKKVNELNEPLAGAKFAIYHKHEDTRLYAKVENDLITGWTMIVDGEDEDTTIESELQAAITDGTVSLVTSAEANADGEGKGLINVAGLKTKTDYFLQEIEAPEGGYNKPLTDTEVYISDYTVDEDGNLITVTYEVNNEPTTQNGDTVKLSITNKQGTVLPSTGGMGTTVLYVVGGILVLAAVVLLVTKKRMKDAA